MEFSVKIENISNVVRKLTIKVPANEVANLFEKDLVEVQKNANLKGFRKGQVPVSVIRQVYGKELRHKLFHRLIEDTVHRTVYDNKLRIVGSPRVESHDHKTGLGDHDHEATEDKDFSFTATVEVLPDIQPKDYFGISLNKENKIVQDEDIAKAMVSIQENRAILIPLSENKMQGDDSSTQRPTQKGDYVDVKFKGGILNEAGDVMPEPMLTGTRFIEVGSDSLVAGFEDQIIGMKKGESKVFRLKYPEDYSEEKFKGKEAEFDILIQEIKVKKLPELNDAFSIQEGFQSLEDLRNQIKKRLDFEFQRETEDKLRSDLIEVLLAKNEFEVPPSIVENQLRALVEEWAHELKTSGASGDQINQWLRDSLENLKKRAEVQVRTSLILEAIGRRENVTLTENEIETEVSQQMKAFKKERQNARNDLSENPERKNEIVFRMKQGKTMDYLISKAKIKVG